MNQKSIYNKLEEVGRIQLSDNFFLREFINSEIAAAYGLINIPENLDLAIESGTRLCEDILEPIQKVWGKVHVRSGYRSKEVNQIGNINKHNCAANASNFAAHIWDERDSNGYTGASACIVIPAYLNHFRNTKDWMSLAWWIHHHIQEYSDMCIFKMNCAFNIRWSANPNKQQKIKSFLVNPDTGDKSQLVNKGVVHSFYQNKSHEERYQVCTELLFN